MDLPRLGRSLRVLRIRRGLRQVDVAVAAKVSRSQVARIERGEAARLPIGDIDAVSRALAADLELRARWQGEGLDRLLDGAHAILVNKTLRLLAHHGWEAAVEVSYNVAGERGSVDVLGHHAQGATALVVEVKSVVPDVQALLAAHDRKTRLAGAIAAGRGWEVRNVGRLLAIGDGSTSRRRITQLETVFATAYPHRGAEVLRWLDDPAQRLSGLLFLPNDRGATLRRSSTGRQRVRRPRSAANPM